MKNERSTKRKSAKSTNATNLEEKLDAGETILNYFDTSQATRPNRRGGAGREPQRHVRLRVYVSAPVREKAQELARSGNTRLGVIIEKALLRLAD